MFLPDADLNRLLGLFHTTRFAATPLYPDVLPALDRLSRRFRMGIVSNGNSYADRIGLSGYFEAEFYAQRVGIRKPNPGLYRFVAEAMDAPPSRCLMVGDSYLDDVSAARAAGWRSILISRPPYTSDHAGGEPSISTLEALRPDA